MAKARGIAKACINAADYVSNTVSSEDSTTAVVIGSGVCWLVAAAEGSTTTSCGASGCRSLARDDSGAADRTSRAAYSRSRSRYASFW